MSGLYFRPARLVNTRGLKAARYKGDEGVNTLG